MQAMSANSGRSIPARSLGPNLGSKAKDVSSSNVLTAQQLVGAYCHGIFPMADPRSGQIHWFCPEQRGVMPLDQFHVPRRLGRTVRQAKFSIRVDTAFTPVMLGCAAPRRASNETWINEQIVRAYTDLHQAGLAHSIEAWSHPATGNPELVGGIYGVHLGGAFFGESMFSRQPDASKVCLAHLAGHLRQRGFTLFDVQYVNPHLAQFGALTITRTSYLLALEQALGMTITW